jgi:hypothetical protein
MESFYKDQLTIYEVKGARNVASLNIPQREH